MKRVKKKTASTSRKEAASPVRTVPLIVPHGGAESGRDFESAFDVLRRDVQVHELWRGQPIKKQFASAS